MKVKVKICGIRNKQNALAAINAGADFLGFNFVKSSKRFIDSMTAKEIAGAIRGKVKIVGVFQNQDTDYINKLVGLLDLDYIQLHGNEEMGFIEKIIKPVIKAMSISRNLNTDKIIMNMRKYNVSYFLLDREKQGKGEMVDIKKSREIAKKFPIFLAGGLNPNNVFEIVREVKPYCVDVASGIESNGYLDFEKVIKFIKLAKGVNL